MGSPHGCMFSYLPGSGALGLIDDAGSQWQWGDLSTRLSNSQCILNIIPDSSYSVQRIYASLNLDITFLTALQKIENINVSASDPWLQHWTSVAYNAVSRAANLV